jgi:hypothetical protein
MWRYLDTFKEKERNKIYREKITPFLLFLGKERDRDYFATKKYFISLKEALRYVPVKGNRSNLICYEESSFNFLCQEVFGSDLFQYFSSISKASFSECFLKDLVKKKDKKFNSSLSINKFLWTQESLSDFLGDVSTDNEHLSYLALYFLENSKDLSHGDIVYREKHENIFKKIAEEDIDGDHPLYLLFKNCIAREQRKYISDGSLGVLSTFLTDLQDSNLISDDFFPFLLKALRSVYDQNKENKFLFRLFKKFAEEAKRKSSLSNIFEDSLKYGVPFGNVHNFYLLLEQNGKISENFLLFNKKNPFTEFFKENFHCEEVDTSEEEKLKAFLLAGLHEDTYEKLDFLATSCDYSKVSEGFLRALFDSLHKKWCEEDLSSLTKRQVKKVIKKILSDYIYLGEGISLKDFCHKVCCIVSRYKNKERLFPDLLILLKKHILSKNDFFDAYYKGLNTSEVLRHNNTVFSDLDNIQITCFYGDIESEGYDRRCKYCSYRKPYEYSFFSVYCKGDCYKRQSRYNKILRAALCGAVIVSRPVRYKFIMPSKRDTDFQWKSFFMPKENNTILEKIKNNIPSILLVGVGAMCLYKISQRHDLLEKVKKDKAQGFLE